MAETPQWEYMVQTFGSMLKRMSDADLMAALNAWGEQGWEVVSVAAVENSYKITVFARRPLTRSTRRERSMPSGF